MHQSYCIKVTMDQLMYPVWRTILIPGDIQLEDLHQLIQAAFGWLDLHDYQFWILEGDKTVKGLPKDPIASLLGKNTTVYYEYDFTDQWIHTIEVEEIIESQKPLNHIKCIGGTRHRPPESVGGVEGYNQFLKVVTDPKHPDYYKLLDWAEKDTQGRKFDPDYFYILEINRRLAHF